VAQSGSYQLPRAFYLRPTLEVAPDLLGKYLVFNSPEGKLVGEINEIEAYMGELDPASHAHRGKTERTEVMFREGGYAYVYFIYGVHYSLNVVTEAAGQARAVLLRSVIPVEGIEVMAKNRGTAEAGNVNEKQLRNLTNGPGKLCQAFGITKEQNGIDLVTSPQMYIEDSGKKVLKYQTSARIGISKANDKMWRFFY
jgi:DNA-3-methyladenine glycosylase